MNIWLIIAGMAIVTYIPRLLPFVSFNSDTLSPRVKAVLQNIPYAILGALIFPGAFQVHADIWVGIIGTCAAFLLAFLRVNVLLVMIGTIGSIVLYLTL